MSGDQRDVLVKVLVLGDPAVGKSSIIKRVISNTFTGVHKPTLGVDFHFRRFEEAGESIALQLWDIAGADRFGMMYRVYYKDALGALLLFDASKPTTFDAVKKWKKEIDDKVTLPNGKPLPVLLLANKCDLEDAQINNNELDEFAQQNGFIGWLSTSAKTAHNVEKAVRTLVSDICSHKDVIAEQKKGGSGGGGGGKVDLEEEATVEGKRSGSCCK